MAASETIAAILANPSDYWACLNLPAQITAPVLIRKAYLRVALKTHPDKVDDPQANEAFQHLSEAFETLYDEVSQKEYLSSSSSSSSQSSFTDYTECTSSSAKRRAAPQSKQWKKKPKKTPHEWTQKRWADVEREMRRREELERAFVAERSTANTDRKLRRLVARAQKICRSLDLREGCPLEYANPLWATLAEADVVSAAGRLPEGWQKRYDHENKVLLFRVVATGATQTEHPVPAVEVMRKKAADAALRNKYGTDEPRWQLGEILDYLRDEEYDEEDWGYLEDEADELDAEIRDAGQGDAAEPTTTDTGVQDF